MTDRFADRLSEYLDHDLPAFEQREIEAHLVTCAACRETFAGLTAVVEHARSAPLTPPTHDLWPAIAARIAPPADAARTAAAGRAETGSFRAPRPEFAAAAPPRSRRAPPSSWFGWRFTLTLPQAAAVAATLMVVAGASVWMALGRGLIPATRGPAITASRDLASPNLASPTAVTPPGTGETSSGPRNDAAVATFDTRYDATVAELQRLLAEDRRHLAPRTIQVLERNLATIDRALADARRAVEADPSSMYLRNHLASVMKRKVDLLRTATMIASDQG
jgi:hypothetical protein